MKYKDFICCKILYFLVRVYPMSTISLLFSDCFFRQEEFNFSLQDYHQALELDPNDETIKSRISVIHNEFGVSAYQDKMYSVSCFTLCVYGSLHVISLLIASGSSKGSGKCGHIQSEHMPRLATAFAAHIYEVWIKMQAQTKI